MLGYLFARWVLFSWQGWGVAVFTTLYLLAATAYLVKKGTYAASRAAWFWLAVTWLAGISFALWDNAGLAPVRAAFLFCSAVYYVLAASGRLLMERTSNYLILDGINATVTLPFKNILNQYVSFSALKRDEGKRRKASPAVFGVLLAVLLLAGLLPMLERADSGGFGIILRFLSGLIRIRLDMLFNVTIYVLCAVPVAAYLYGLVSGAAHNKGTEIITQNFANKTVVMLRLVQPTTIYIVLGAVCGLYLVFIFSQIPYLFSAFSGLRPEGWLNYAEYARQGFFELCSIAAINLGIVAFCNITCKKQRSDSRVLKAFNISLALITLALICAAFSKMALYISVYGLTMPRLLPCFFMVFLAAVFVALIALQKWDFSIVRFALVLGSVMLCSLFLCNPDALVVRYNTDRYLRGSLAEYDVEVLYRSGFAGVSPAYEVLEFTSDRQVRYEVGQYLEYQRSLQSGVRGGLGRGMNEYSFEMHSAEARLRN
ncbi:MAG: DUF4173 domain-containing protein [Oscillospiraceae bacterium]|nr:DUF4173 domain-containing protein [Oscillospiraceae bacterium]